MTDLLAMTNRIDNSMQKSLIDLLKIQMLPNNKQSAIEFIHKELLPLLKKYGIKQSYRKPNLKYFNEGILLFSDDETNAVCGSIKWQGKTQYVQLELSGNGCYYFTTSDDNFSALHSLAESYQGKVIEIDIAVDDFSGKYNLRRLNQDYCADKFNGSRGSKPRRKLQNNDGAKSILIGSRNSRIQFQGYDRSREQELDCTHLNYNNWTRLEVSLYRRVGAVIPLDCLLLPDNYFVGAYPKALKKVLKGVEPRCIIREQTNKKVEDIIISVMAQKKQWGKTTNLIAETVGDKAIALDVIRRDGYPKSFKTPSYLSKVEVINALNVQFLSLAKQTNNARGS